MTKFKLISLFLALALLVAGPAIADVDLECAPVSDNMNPTEARATNDYVNLTDGTFSTTAAAEDEFVVPVTSKVWGLWADIDVAPGAGDIWTIIVVDDSTNTTVDCTISGASATSCQSDRDEVATVLKGSDLTVLVSSADGATDPAAAAELRWGFCISK